MAVDRLTNDANDFFNGIFSNNQRSIEIHGVLIIVPKTDFGFFPSLLFICNSAHTFQILMLGFFPY